MKSWKAYSFKGSEGVADWRRSFPELESFEELEAKAEKGGHCSDCADYCDGGK
jgi:hypothetical protein